MNATSITSCFFSFDGTINFFHDHAMLVLIMITVLVGYFMLTLMFNLIVNRFLLDGQLIEIIWTVFPALILIGVALPSLRLLYLLDEVNEPSLTLKSVGHQWYWSYEYSDFLDVEFDSYMLPITDLDDGGFRLLDVDNRMVIPFGTQIRLLVTAADVLHSWAVPSMGVKADAIPGRLNQISFLVNRPGLYYGQCSEICGANHSFMPIVLESVSVQGFLNWVSEYNV
uniref:Cytochrome c oxidase subunit 2 n=1 Tax=Limnadia lenticularis TaxID=84336 RepID=A0A3G1RRW8_9CRUS|nr:cytochrome c oxidase subunit II [Limnadia lenticularis]AXH81650.1 cytochrome c oxidase subunit II [Limnadia lenticularis]